MKNEDWMQDNTLKDIDKKKLEFLQNLNASGNFSNPAALMAFLTMSQNKMKKNKISFSDAEAKLIFDALKKGKSPSEIKKIDKMIEIVQMAQKNSGS